MGMLISSSCFQSAGFLLYAGNARLADFFLFCVLSCLSLCPLLFLLLLHFFFPLRMGRLKTRAGFVSNAVSQIRINICFLSGYMLFRWPVIILVRRGEVEGAFLFRLAILFFTAFFLLHDDVVDDDGTALDSSQLFLPKPRLLPRRSNPPRSR